MRLLLDTHIFLWLISDDPRLRESLKKEIVDRENTVHLSVASIWEIVVKNELGRLPLPESPATYIPRERELHQIESLPLIENDLQFLPTLPALHRDPFDRLLICQALNRGMTLVTVDPVIMEYDVTWLG